MGISEEWKNSQWDMTIESWEDTKIGTGWMLLVGVKRQGDCEMDLFSSVSKESVFNGYGSTNSGNYCPFLELT